MAKARDVPGLHAELPYRLAAAATVRVRADEVFEHVEHVLDTSDIERVHAMRVATRRLRAVLEVYEVCFPRDDYKAALRDVKRLADALGARRDPDVQLDALRKVEEQLDPADAPGFDVVLAELAADQARGNEVLAAELDEIAAHGLAERLQRLADAAEAGA